MELPPYRFPSWSQIFQQMFNRAVIFLHRAGTVILSLSVLFWFMTHFPTNSSNTSHQSGDRLEYSYAGRIGHAIEPLIQPIGMDWKIGICLIAAQTAREVFCSTLAIVYHAEKIVGESPNKLKEILYQQKKSDGKIVFTPLTSLSIMLFFVFSMQCFSTVAIVRRETNSFFWPIFQFVFMTTFAYAVSFIVYQTGIFFGFH